MICQRNQGPASAAPIDAIVDEFKENEDLPNTTNPDDWARISGEQGEKITFVKTLIFSQGASRTAGRGLRTSRSVPDNDVQDIAPVETLGF